jgi:hypothetical protein
MNIPIILILSLIAPIASADETSFSYHLGAMKVVEDYDKIVVHSTPPVAVSILPGGPTWPALSLDETGKIYAGNVVIDPATGILATNLAATLVLPYGLTVAETKTGFKLGRAGTRCVLSQQQLGMDRSRSPTLALKHHNIDFKSTATGVLALVTQFGQDGDTPNYLVQEIDLDSCRIVFRASLGNPDLLVELGHSTEGGWWITGSIEQTLLQSNDGRHWRNATLPAALSSLVSAYVVNLNEIWLAAILPEGKEDIPYLLVYSGDGGHTWRNVIKDDPLLARLPPGWLEGQKRRVQQ